MIQERILTLLSQPELMVEEDLTFLEKELKTFPYWQSLRAVYLQGVHKFKQDNYKEELTLTAAYTTDKKILYQMINGKIALENLNRASTDDIQEEDAPLQEELNPQNDVVHQEVENTPLPNERSLEIEEAPTDNNPSHSEEATLSFTVYDEFLPEVKIPTKEKTSSYAPSTTLNSKEEEMKRLIAEVEAKMKANKKHSASLDKNEDESQGNSEINFSESFYERISTLETGNLSPEKNLEDETKEVNAIHQSEVEPQKETFYTESDKEPTSNVSTFINTWQNWLQLGKKDNAQKSVETHLEKEDLKMSIIDKFLETNPKITKLDASKIQSEKEVEMEIETEEVSPADISHLMTETLANLYVLQKRYPKAIQAFEILAEKHPDKKEEYQRKIAEINGKISQI